MRKYTLKHSNLRKCFDMMDSMDDVEDEVIDRLLGELKHSNLIIAADFGDGDDHIVAFETDGRKYGFLFTDMDEFRKFVPDEECGSKTYDFEFYKKMVDGGITDGFVVNLAGENFVLYKELFQSIKYFPQHSYSPKDAYTPSQLKVIKDSINNEKLEEFIKNPSNMAKYEQLFERISGSSLLTLLLSDDDLTILAEDGVISMEKTGPLGFLYLDEIGGNYTTVYTSESRIKNIQTPFYKYFQLVNFSQMTNYILNDDLDGIIINPGDEKIVLTREVLLEYWHFIQEICNNSKLNSAIMCMFLIDE